MVLGSLPSLLSVGAKAGPSRVGPWALGDIPPLHWYQSLGFHLGLFI